MTLADEEQKIRYLYKYKPINCYLYDILENNRLYLTNPTELNDPFDCRPNISWEGNTKDWERWIEGMYYSLDMKKQLKNNIELLKYDSKKLSEVAINEMKKLLVLCFTEINDNILMWTHYADNHRGVCLAFKTTIEKNMLGILFEDSALKVPIHNVRKGFIRTMRVNYTIDMPPAYNPLEGDISKAMKFAYTKHIDWSYEKERRITLTTFIASSNFLNFNKNVLQKVIFGMNTSQKDEKKIREIIERKYLSQDNTVEFYKAYPVQGKYKINITNI